MALAFCKLVAFRVILLLPWLKNAQITAEIGFHLLSSVGLRVHQESFAVWLLSLLFPRAALFLFFIFLVLKSRTLERIYEKILGVAPRF